MAAKAKGRKRWPDRRGIPPPTPRDRRKLARLAAEAIAAAWHTSVLCGMDEPDTDEEWAAHQQRIERAFEAEQEARHQLWIAMAWSDVAKRDPMELNDDYAVVLPDGSVIGLPCGFDKHQGNAVLAAPPERVIRLDVSE